MNIELFTVKGKPNRDPRGHTISIFYLVEVGGKDLPQAADDAETAQFYELNEIVKRKEDFAFDHFDVLEELIKKKGIN